MIEIINCNTDKSGHYFGSWRWARAKKRMIERARAHRRREEGKNTKKRTVKTLKSSPTQVGLTRPVLLYFRDHPITIHDHPLTSLLPEYPIKLAMWVSKSFHGNQEKQDN